MARETMSDNASEAQTPWDADAPRQEVDLYGDPVASEQIGELFYEAYSSSDRADVLFVAKYEWADGEWVKLGFDRHRVSSLFNADGWPTE